MTNQKLNHYVEVVERLEQELKDLNEKYANRLKAKAQAPPGIAEKSIAVTEPPKREGNSQ